MVWHGTRALGIHPWHPDARKLNIAQLHWAFLQGEANRRDNIKRARSEKNSEIVAELLAWYDDHVTT